MKKIAAILIIFLSAWSINATAQSYELQRLILDIEKLSQLKSLLSDLYKGYEVLNTGYSTVKDISEGNFNLHKAFLDGLLAVSPTVRNYERVEDIIADQARIVSEYQEAYGRFRQDSHFTPDEITYLGQVYNNLFTGSINNLNHLLDILTPGRLRMSDAERLHGIDGIYLDTLDKLMFLRKFNSDTQGLATSRAARLNDIQGVQSLYEP